MNWADAVREHQEADARRLEVRTRKARDYSRVDVPEGDQDVLSNFKLRAALWRAIEEHTGLQLGRTAESVALFDVLLKFSRICNLLALDQEAMNEPLIDSYLDMTMYVELARECHLDYEDEATLPARLLREMIQGNPSDDDLLATVPMPG